MEKKNAVFPKKNLESLWKGWRFLPTTPVGASKAQLLGHFGPLWATSMAWFSLEVFFSLAPNLENPGKLMKLSSTKTT